MAYILQSQKAMLKFWAILLFTFLFRHGGMTTSAQFLEFETNLNHATPPPLSLLSIRPNEYEVRLVKGILSKSIAGVFISVGTERGFMEFALSNATHLLLIDRNVNVVRFNRINICLLQLSKNQKDFLWLRKEATHSDWIDRLKMNSAMVDPKLAEFVALKQNFDFWREAVSYNELYPTLHGDSSDRSKPFFEANYVQDPRLYERAAKVAKKGQMESHLLDILDNENLRKLVAAIKKSNLRLSVIETSNMSGGDYYPSADQLNKFMKELNVVSSDSTLWVATRFRPDGSDTDWIYLATRLGQSGQRRRRQILHLNQALHDKEFSIAKWRSKIAIAADCTEVIKKMPQPLQNKSSP